MSRKTKGWAVIGFAFLIGAAAFYGLALLLGTGAVLTLAFLELGAAAILAFLVPGMMAIGFLILCAKVIIDRLSNEEDDHYSKTVER